MSTLAGLESTLLDLKSSLLERINNRTAIVGVVGLGYVGLPFAVEAVKAGFKVIGVEQNPNRADKINRGENYIGDVKDEELKEAVESGKLEAVLDFSRVPEMDCIIIAVPTPLNKNLAPDLSYIESVTRGIAPYLRKGQLVSLESTTFPGTTEEVMKPILDTSGLVPDEDYYLAHSPERVDPGNRRFNTKNTNKVVGGVGPNSLEVAEAMYKTTIESVVTVSSAKAAELTKVFENTFRSVNIALVNELAKLCDKMNLNVWEVLEAANTKPFGIMQFMPGPGVGGHCIPLDPHYLEWKAREYNFNTRFIALAGEINRSMPEYVRDRATRCLNELGVAPSRAKVLILGVAYKKDIDDWRESPSIEVLEQMMEIGADVRYYDPFVSSFKERKVELSSTPLEEGVAWADLVIITTDHTDVDYDFVCKNAKKVLDTRNATKFVSDKSRVTLL